MKIGVLIEVKNNENCVVFILVGVDWFVWEGYRVFVQFGVGVGLSIDDDVYCVVGVEIVVIVVDVWGDVDLFIKVKELVVEEYGFFCFDFMFFIYFYFVVDCLLIEVFIVVGMIVVVYEIVQLFDCMLFLLVLMSEIVGCLFVIMGLYLLLCLQGGCGMLLGGIVGILWVKIVVIGGGVVGEYVVVNVFGFGLKVIVVDVVFFWLCEFEYWYGGVLEIWVFSCYDIVEELMIVDFVIGLVFIFGVVVFKFVIDDMVVVMKLGLVFVDIVIDQGGCFEGLCLMMYDDLMFVVYDLIYYCVVNMLGVVLMIVICVLMNVIFFYVLVIVVKGWEWVVFDDVVFVKGFNVQGGCIMLDVVVQVYGFFID